MRRDELNDLAAFARVADEGSFTRAAAGEAAVSDNAFRLNDGSG
jgi:hypothetical protein